MVREKKGSVKILELDSNNRDADRDSPDESDIDESSDSLRPLEYYPCTFAPLRFLLFSLFSSPSHSSVCILFRLPHFSRPVPWKSELQKIISLPSAPWVHCETQGLFGDSHINFPRRLTIIMIMTMTMIMIIIDIYIVPIQICSKHLTKVKELKRKF